MEKVVAEQAAEIARLRSKVKNMQEERTSTPEASFVASPARTPRRPPPAKSGKPSKPPAGYKLFGTLPEEYDPTAAEALIGKRIVARQKKRYSQADRYQKRLFRMGIKLDDRRRTWSLRPNWKALHEDLEAEDQQSWRQQQELQRELETRIKDIFAYWDQNGNGLIDRAEFRLAVQVLGIAGTDAEFDAMFDEWDVDSSGALNFKEIREALIALQKKQPEMLETAHMTVTLLS